MKTIRQLSIKGLFLPAIALCSLLLSGNAAHATLVSYSFTGSVTDVNGSLMPTLNLTSSPVLGTFQFKDDTLPSGIGNYPGAVETLSFTIGSFTYNLAPGSTNGITISNDEFLVGDRWRLQTSVSGPQINGFNPLLFDINLTDELGRPFSSTALQSPPTLDLLSSARWRLIFENSDGVARIQGGISLTPVPLPAAVILFGAGLISLVGLGAGGLRNLRWPQA